MTCQTVEKGGGKRKVRLKHGKEARKEEMQRKVTGQRGRQQSGGQRGDAAATSGSPAAKPPLNWKEGDWAGAGEEGQRVDILGVVYAGESRLQWGIRTHLNSPKAFHKNKGLDSF